MTDQVLPLHANVHRKVDALLPWYVNGTLKPEELELVQKHLDECGLCRREVEWLRELHAACIACAAQDGDARVFDTLRRHEKPGRLSTRVWRVAAVAQIAVIAVLGWQLWSVDDQTAVYRTLAAQNAVVSGNVVVVFDPTAPESEMRRLLQSVEARIVGGPTAGNGYVLSVPVATQAHAVAELRAARIVKLAQALRPQETP